MAGSEGEAKSGGGEKVVLGYWAIRGLAQPIRYLLEYTGTPYEDVRYTLQPKEGGGWDRSEWTDVKFTLGLEFPNLPYLLDGDIKLTQSNACLRHIGRKHNLNGATEAEMCDVDLLLDESMDLRNTITKVAYTAKDDFDAAMAAWRRRVPHTLKVLEARLAAGREWFAGGLTVADFVLFELLDQARGMLEGAVAFAEAYPSLAAFLERFAALPAIAAYRKRDDFIEHPINNLSAVLVVRRPRRAGWVGGGAAGRRRAGGGVRRACVGSEALSGLARDASLDGRDTEHAMIIFVVQ
eukprot:CAMPEP_0203822688 /NCGR_PEP_ID=MMETSP0115-20131106/46965_1 /ASSEMBLY_ACC=CAM_ASM_000227 /TAXON_ID=33651 /ORGANISM="Bicosoecid sp, Strain ms1" /LENGTH=294 /DNA_ID=CAMNT_0050731723 /DNA_START=10 /DNA_END=890 /DNA_ORIENTATION=+